MIHTYHRIDYFSGWRFLFSPEYRREVRKRWSAQPPHVRFLDIAGGALTLLVTAFAVLLVALLLLDLTAG